MADSKSKPIHPRTKDLSRQKFGRLTVLRYAGVQPHPCGKVSPLWFCVCKCGNTKITTGALLRRRETRSCGCLQREVTSANKHKHGMCGKKIYNIWQNMLHRCLNPRNPAFSNYGGRGIKVCARWKKFENFYADMGNPPPERTLDREDNDGPYSLKNCRWATRVTQANNSRKNVFLTYQGQTHTLAQWSRKVGIDPTLLSHRLIKNWSPEKALFHPSHPLPKRK